MTPLKLVGQKFAHHHVHTEYSPQDAPVSLKKLVKCAADKGYKSLTLTDHGTVSGWVKFSKYCKDAGIKPILGVEAYFVPDRKARGGKRNNHHMVLIAKNNEGIRNIFRMTTAAWTDGFYYDPRIDWDLLEKYHEGVICTSACVSGIIPETLVKEGSEAARKIAERFHGLFKNDFYMELQYHCLDIEKSAYSGVAKLAADMGVKVLGTNDVHYLRKEDATIQEIMVAINTGRCMKDPTRMRHETNQLYLKDQDEMVELFGGRNSRAVESSLEIADVCTAELQFGKVQLPSTEIPKGFRDDFEYLEHLARAGLKARGKDTDPVYVARVNEELDVIRKLREKGFMFDRYFLVVEDYVRWAWDNNIRVGVGRGSGAGSLLLWCLRITGIDPIPLDLLFERFLTPDRTEMPDIDIDFESEGGERVYEYVCQKYGVDKCARIGTFQVFHVAGAIKAAFRAFDPGCMFEERERQKAEAAHQKKTAGRKMSQKGEKKKGGDIDRSAQMANQITKLLPRGGNDQPDPKCTLLEEVHKKDPEGHPYVYADTQFQELRKKYPEEFKFAEQIEGLISNRSVHAAGVVITQDPIVDVCPKQLSGKEKNESTAFDMNDVADLGLIKFDFLYTKVLSVLSRCVRMVKARYNIDVDIDNVRVDDKKVLDIFTKAETEAIFQFESRFMKGILSDMKPSTFEDIISANALGRPGPMDNIPSFNKRKHGVEQVSYPVKILEDVLKPTYGIMVYQEQVMKIVRLLAGFDTSGADAVRKAMGKKKMDILEKQKQKFLDGTVKLGTCPMAVAEDLWAQMEKFGAYAFNKSHSAGYAYTAYQCAWFKAYYPAEFMAAQMTVEGGDGTYEVVDRYEKFIRTMGIRMLPLDVNKSKADYQVVDLSDGKVAIRRGFKGINGMGGQSSHGIEAGQPYKDMFDFCKRSGSRTNVCEILLDMGAMDCFLPGLSKDLRREAKASDLRAEYADKSWRATNENRLKGPLKEEKEAMKSMWDDEDEVDLTT